MTTAFAALVAGVVLAVLGVVGGVAAVTPNANSTSVTGTAVTYDGS